MLSHMRRACEETPASSLFRNITISGSPNTYNKLMIIAKKKNATYLTARSYSFASEIFPLPISCPTSVLEACYTPRATMKPIERMVVITI